MQIFWWGRILPVLTGVWHARDQIFEYPHQVPEEIDADEMGVFRDALKRDRE
jgi:hypothetical protein